MVNSYKYLIFLFNIKNIYICCMLRISHNDFDGFINGDNTAFERIFHLYYKTLLSFSMRHDIRKMDAEDIVL